MPKIDTPKLKCLRPKCGHEWWPRQDNVGICPKCKSHLWNEKPKRRKKIKPEITESGGKA
ncbi:hypothetical protein LCGC14_0480840 [marine sediment metagenome]|uniref:Uncharacterized protein n=1 Tax=marine sediment metagenome TaxID=412755 RepID=A0A0F9S9A7_9ZZZZ